MKSRLGLSFAVLASCLFSTTTSAHEDDPKVLDRRPPYQGKGYRRDLAVRNQTSELKVDFASDDVTLLSWLPLTELDPNAVSGNDCWGYVSGSGREYALVGLNTGTAFVEVTQPGNAQLVAFQSGPDSLWRDVKVYQDHAYVVSEGGSGIQVFDMSSIDSGVVVDLGDFTSPLQTSTATHNVVIDEDSGYLYRTGGDFHGLRVYSLANPSAPAYVSSWDDRYIHDAQAVTMTSGPWAGREIVFACSGFDGGFTNTGLDILDVTDKNDIEVLANVFYSNAAYSHQAWLSPDRQYLYLNDELDEDGFFPSTTIIFDVSDLENPFATTTSTNGNPAITHNVYTKGDLLYASNYTDGLRVFDITNRTNPVEVASFDTFPDTDQTTFNSLWSNYPYLPSGIILGSDLEKGLFVWWVGERELDFAFPGGLADAVEPGGGILTVDVTEEAGALAGGTVTLHVDTGSGFSSVLMSSAGGDSYEAPLPALPCGSTLDFYVTAESGTGIVWSEPAGAPISSHQLTSSLATLPIATFDMEADDGWIVGDFDDDATTGVWQRGNPLDGSAAQPDEAKFGSSAWVTELGTSGQAYFEHDIDGGKTTLFSPELDLDDYADAIISYWRWFSNDEGGFKDTESFVVDITDDGSSWVNVETVGPSGFEASSGWYRHQFTVSDFVNLTDEVQLRFIARDEQGGIIEAAIDELNVVELICDPLSTDKTGLSLASGGTQTMRLNAGVDRAGLTYWILGAAGTSPGFSLQGNAIPLNVDFYLNLSIILTNQAPFTNSLGLLNGSGSAQTLFSVPPGSDASLAGIQLYHAYLAFDEDDIIQFVSNAVPVLFQP